jgi:hypothetical protein
MIHKEPHPKSGETVKVKLDGEIVDYVIADWWDRVSGGSWQFAKGNPACLKYAARTGFSKEDIPFDDEVVYGKIGGLGNLFHVTEIID